MLLHLFHESFEIFPSERSAKLKTKFDCRCNIFKPISWLQFWKCAASLRNFWCFIIFENLEFSGSCGKLLAAPSLGRQVLLAAETFSLLSVYLNYKFGLGLPSFYLFFSFFKSKKITPKVDACAEIHFQMKSSDLSASTNPKQSSLFFKFYLRLQSSRFFRQICHFNLIFKQAKK